jgi:hypothetical protein
MFAALRHLIGSELRSGPQKEMLIAGISTAKIFGAAVYVTA